MFSILAHGYLHIAASGCLHSCCWALLLAPAQVRNLGIEPDHDAEGLSNHVAQEDGHLKSGKEINKLQLTRWDKPGSGSVRQVCKHADPKDSRLDQSRLPYITLPCSVCLQDKLLSCRWCHTLFPDPSMTQAVSLCLPVLALQ